MKRILICFLLVFAGCSQVEEQQPLESGGLPFGEVEVFAEKGDVKFKVEIAQTAEEKRRGLMFRENLAQDAGMIFVYDQPQISNFWMRSTLIPLDMIAIDEDENIVNIVKNAQPCEEGSFCKLYPTNVPAKYVLEINGGLSDQFGFAVGDEVDLDI